MSRSPAASPSVQQAGVPVMVHTSQTKYIHQNQLHAFKAIIGLFALDSMMDFVT